MRLVETGRHIARERRACGLSRAELTLHAGLTRSTVNRIEQGTDSDIGFKQLATLLEHLGSAYTVEPLALPRVDELLIAIASAASDPALVRLYPDELLQAVLTGRPAPHKAALVQNAIEEMYGEERQALLVAAGRLSGDPSRAEAGFAKLELNLGKAPESDLAFAGKGRGLIGSVRRTTS